MVVRIFMSGPKKNGAHYGVTRQLLNARCCGRRYKEKVDWDKNDSAQNSARTPHSDTYKWRTKAGQRKEMEPTAEKLQNLTKEVVLLQPKTMSRAVHKLFKLVRDLSSDEPTERDTIGPIRELTQREIWLWRHTSPKSL